jgi:tetratricopeptide (TPR) repeat protein
MRGRALLSWANLENVTQSISYFEKAVEVDPDYAMAWGYLSYARLATSAWRSFDEVGPASIDAYERALALDSEQSEALATKALITQITQHDWYAAGMLYQNAVTSREDTLAIAYYGQFYLPAINRMPQAIRLYRDAERRDPLHAGFKANLSGLLLWSGDTEAAVRKAREALQLNPRHQPATAILILAYSDAGNFQAIQRLVEQMPPAFREQPRIKLHIGLYYAAQGNEKRARQIYGELLDDPPPYGLIYTAELALRLGEVEEAINIMEREVEKNSWLQFWIPQIFGNNDIARHHPRFLALLKRIGLDDESVAALHSRMSFD